MAGMQTDMKTRQRSNRKNCSPLEHFGKHWGKALYPSGYNTKACLMVEDSLTVVVYPAVVVYQKVVVVIVVLEMIILGTTMMNARTWIIQRRRRLLKWKRCANPRRPIWIGRFPWYVILSKKNIPYEVFYNLEWMSFEITFNLE